MTSSRRKLGNFPKYGNVVYRNYASIREFRAARSLQLDREVTLRIEKISGQQSTTIKLIGRVEAEYLPELKGQMEASAPSVVLELSEVTLVDVDVVRFLSICESEGVRLLHCSAYIREWILREKDSAIKR
jgi:hypothetical protein